MSLLSVYVEGAKDTSAQGVRRLAALIAARYGLGAEDLEKRLTTGRFRVKANVDVATAQAFAADLEALGARCSITGNAAALRPASGLSAATNVREADSTLNPPALRGLPSSGLSAATVTAAAREPEVSSLNPPTLRGLSAVARTPAHSGAAMPAASRTTTLPFAGLPQRAAAPSTNPPTSSGGLSSALADAAYDNPSGLGALDGASFSLSPLDGHADVPPDYDAETSYTPTTSFDDSPAHATPPGYDSYPPKRPSSRSRPPVDLFAPPEEDGPQEIHLAEELRPPRRSSLAPEGAPMRAPAVAPAVAPPFVPRVGSDASTARRLKARLRIAFAAGVFAAVLLGLVPAHLVAKARARTAFERIDNRARIAQSEITTMTEWAALDDVRTALLRQKRAAHQEISLLSILLWVGLSGALSFTWFRFGLIRFEPDHGERER
jgi:hypothetical protein